MRQVESTERHSGSQVGEAGGVHSVRGFEGSIKMSTGARRWATWRSPVNYDRLTARAQHRGTSNPRNNRMNADYETVHKTGLNSSKLSLS